MTSDVSMYVPLKQIVAYAMDEENKGYSNFEKCWGLAFRALIDLTYDISGQPKTLRLPVLGNKTVEFPSGCLSWSKIGILNERGEVSTLKINNALTTFRDTNPGRTDLLTGQINDTLSVTPSSPYYANYYYNGGCYQLYGVGGGLIQYGECRVDEANRVVILPTDCTYDSIIFEYINVPERDDDYEVPLLLQEAIIMFIRWKLKTATRQDYYGAVTSARRRLNNKKVTLQSINQILRESEGMKLRS